MAFQSTCLPAGGGKGKQNQENGAFWRQYLQCERIICVILSQQFCHVFCQTSTKYEQLVLSQEDVGHLCSVIPAVEELLLDGVGTKDQK